jgi:uncharacterized membrane protein
MNQPLMPLTKNEKARQVELVISNLLRVGVVVSLCVVLFGTVVSFVHNPDYVLRPEVLDRVSGKTAQFPHTVGDVLRGLIEFRGKAIVMFGLLILIGTPVLRVAVSIVGFVYERDAKYVVFTAIVLALLILSFFIGNVEH